MTAAHRAVWRYVARYRPRYTFGVVCLLLASVFSLSIPWTVKNAIEALSGGAATARNLGGYVVLIIVFAAAHAIVRLGSRFAMIGAAQRIEYDLKNDLYRCLQALPPAFYRSQRTGDLMSRASSDISAVKSLVGFGGVSLVGTTFAFIGTLTAMLTIDPWLTLWAMAPLPALVWLARRFNTSMHLQTQAVQDQLGTLSARVQENLSGISVVRAYTMEPREIATFGRLNGEYTRRSLALARVQAQFGPLMGLVAGIGTLIILWLGGRAVLNGQLTLGGLVAFNGYLAHLAWPTIALGWTLTIVRRGLTSMERIREILAQAPHGDVTGPDSVVAMQGRVEMKDLTFAYEDGAPVLRNVTLSIAPGETVAVVGPTGSGKSTLGTLLARLNDPPPGAVFVDGRDVRDLDAGALRRAIGFVPQESFLFSRSLRDNVAFGRDDATMDQLTAAAHTASILEEIEQFPDGWDTLVGERGLTLSGGQRQRVALARALVTEPRLLILDDVFASVDAQKEAEITARLRDAFRGRTALLITHRLRAAQLADRVIVLTEGRVVEQGTHAELLGRGGVYARLWRIQQLEDEIARA